MTESVPVPRIIVPIPPGHSTDISSPAIQERLRDAYNAMCQDENTPPDVLPFDDVQWTWHQMTEKEISQVHNANPQMDGALVFGRAWMATG